MATKSIKPDETGCKSVAVKTKDGSATKSYEFEDYLLKRKLLAGILEKGWKSPSPIQEATIPVALKGRDILTRAHNGTDKSSAYVIPILEQIDATSNTIQALIAVPTRESAVHAAQVCIELSRHLGCQVLTTTYDTNLKEDLARVQQRHVHIAIATPDRLFELLKSGQDVMEKCVVLVMDEADQLLSHTFENVMKAAVSFLSPDRQILLYSETFPAAVEKFIKKHMHNPYEINLLGESTTAAADATHSSDTPKQAQTAEKTKKEESTDNKRIQLMKSMAQLRLEAEISQLEISCKSVDKIKLSAYFVIDTFALCDHLKVVQDLAATRNYIIIVPFVVIDHLDFIKKDNKLAREAIKWLESQLKQGNRFLRVQTESEKTTNKDCNGVIVTKKDVSAWRFFHINECCKYFQQKYIRSIKNSQINLLVGNLGEFQAFETKYSCFFKNFEENNIEVLDIKDFLKN